MPEPAPYQNTLGAYNKALSYHNGFECDACLSKDGTVYMIHPTRLQDNRIESDLNHHLQSPFEPPRFFEDLTDKEIQNIKLKDGAPIPTLTQTLALFADHVRKHPELLLNIELKSQGVASPVANALIPFIKEGFLATENVMISTFNHEELAIMHQLLPHVPRGLLFAHRQHAGTAYYTSLSSQRLKNAASHQAHYAILPTGALTQTGLNLLKLQGMQLMLWTESEKADPKLKEHLASALRSGILKAVIADNPREVTCLINSLISS